MSDPRQKRVLIVDDNVAIHDDFYKILKPSNKVDPFAEAEGALFGGATEEVTSEAMETSYILDSAYQGQEALELVKKSVAADAPYALAFVDIRMPPGWDGIETIQRIWDVDPNIQMVICTAYSDYFWEEVVRKLKATDNFLILKKPFDVIEIRQLAWALTKKWALQAQVKYQIDNLESLVKERTDNLQQSLSTAKTALDDRLKMQQQLTYQATHDSLTSLPNRILLNDRIQQAISQAKRYNTYVGILLFDLDKFKQVNDRLGHDVGDDLLQLVAKRLKTYARETDTIARLGGDEFVIVLPSLSSEADISAKAIDLIKLFKEPCLIQNQPVMATTSIGISVYPTDGENAEALLKHADVALYKAKEAGRSKFQFYKAEFNESIARRIELTASLRQAVENNELILHYQPIYDLNKRLIVGVEALVRWMHPRLGLLPPQQFIPLAEEMELMGVMGEWVLRTACMQNKIWHHAVYPGLRMAVNVSKDQLRQDHFVDTVKHCLQETTLEPHFLDLEVTESMLLTDVADISKKMTALKTLGVHLSVDDFGTGHASLSCIKYFPFDRVKIDKSFIEGIQTSSDDNFIIEAIINMAKRMEIKVLAENVETEEQLDFLRLHHCDEVQGYYFSAPVDEPTCTALLLKQKSLMSSATLSSENK